MLRLLVSAAFVAVALPAMAANIAVTNSTGADYDEFYLTVPGKAPSTKNLLEKAPEKSFENGMTYTFKNVKEGVYDVHVYDPEDPTSDCTYKAVPMKGKKVVLTEDMRKANCGG